MGKSRHARSTSKPFSQSSTSIPHQRKPMIPKGGAASSNPKTSRFRAAARNLRLAKLAPMVAVDDRSTLAGTSARSEDLGQKGEDDLLRQLSMVSSGSSAIIR